MPKPSIWKTSEVMSAKTVEDVTKLIQAIGKKNNRAEKEIKLNLNRILADKGLRVSKKRGGKKGGITLATLTSPETYAGIETADFATIKKTIEGVEDARKKAEKEAAKLEEIKEEIADAIKKARNAILKKNGLPIEE